MHKEKKKKERMLLTKYRTGSHYLHIQSGRATNIPRNQRRCKCNEIQTLNHVIFHCMYTTRIRTTTFIAEIKTLEDFFNQDNKVTASTLFMIEKLLKLR